MMKPILLASAFCLATLAPLAPASADSIQVRVHTGPTHVYHHYYHHTTWHPAYSHPVYYHPVYYHPVHHGCTTVRKTVHSNGRTVTRVSKSCH